MATRLTVAAMAIVIEMIDTITLKHVHRRIDTERLLQLGFTASLGGRNPRWFHNPPRAIELPRLSVTQSPDMLYHIYAECSLPRFLYGHNARLLRSDADVFKGLEKMCLAVEGLIKLRFEARSARIAKLHLTRDYNLGDAANTAAMALFDKRIKYFPKRTLTANNSKPVTLYFNSIARRRNCVICIYSKHAEVLARRGCQDELEAAQGNLRIEYRANNLTGVNSVCKRFSAEPAELLGRELNDKVFSFIESDLHFPECINRIDPPLTKLLEFYSPTKAKNLTGFLEMRRLLGDEELMKTDKERRSFHSSRRACEKAGVWLDHRQTEE